MSLLLTLRSRTREAHERLEAEVDVPGKWQDRSAYGALLAAFRSVYAPLEHELDASAGTPVALPDWAQRRGKTGWLDEDLAALDVPAAPPLDVPPLTTAEDVAGTAYVLEGATLGGAVVLRSLDPSLPHRFFTAYGPERGRRWRDFRSHLDGLTGLDQDAVVASADRTFALVHGACTGSRP